MKPMFRTLGIAASGLSAQRARLEAAASNIANAETTQTSDGAPYRRLIVQLAEKAPEPSPPYGAFPVGGTPWDLSAMGPAPAFGVATANPIDQANGVLVTRYTEDQTEGPLVYRPGHPNADANGYVRMPNVNIAEESAELMDAKRLYEANQTVFQVMRGLLKQTIRL
jgi:flagellar basal-body rod protein FlgC